MAPEAMLNLDAGQCSCQGMKPLDRRKAKASQKRCESHSYAGTPNFVAPEVLIASYHGVGSYNQSCDWWSVGCIFYEMVIGRAPFQTNDPFTTTEHRIVNWKKYLNIPEGKISPDGEDLIRRFITDPEHRLGRTEDGGSDSIKQHNFFKDIKFEEIRNEKVHPAPWIPNMENEEDTTNFPDIPCSKCKNNSNTCNCSKNEATDEVDNGDYENIFPGMTFRRHWFNKQQS